MRAATALIASADIDEGGYLRVRGRRLTAEDVQRLITVRLVEHHCFVRDVIVAGGTQGADPHERGHGPLRAHEAIVIEIFPQHLGHGYWGDLTRTVLRGEAPVRLRRMYTAVRAAQVAALNRIRAGVSCASVHRAACAEFEKRGLKTEVKDGRATGFIHGTGHGVGLAIHEAPSLGLGPGRLKAGNVVTVEPGYYDPGLGGIRIEDTVQVTRTGWRYLVPCEKRFEL
jgi:Xaa-Pro aminopeptidase